MTLNILAVDYDGERFAVLRSHDGQPPIPHVFPADTLEWRAAEYGIDPSDTDMLLRVVLYEPLIDHRHDDPLHLYQAPTVEAAREHHLTRVGAAMAAHPLVDAGDALAVVHRHAPMHPGALAVKRQHVAQVRAHVARGRAAYASSTDQERLAGLRQQLARPQPPGPPAPQAKRPDTNAVIRSLTGGQD